MSSLKQNINTNIINREPFWGAYEDLNYVKTPTAEAIQRYQLQKLKQFSDIAVKKNAKAQKINELFTSGDVNSLSSIADNEESLQLDTAITKIVTNIQEFRDLTKWTLQKDNAARYEQAQAKLKELSAYLTLLKEKVNINSAVYDSDLDRLNHLISINSLRSFGQAEMAAWIKDLKHIQGELVEELGTAWMAKRIPQDLEILPVSTGKVYYTGGKHGTAGSLIQDILTVDIGNIDVINSLEVKYKMGEQTITTTLGNFLNKLSYYNGKEQIRIDDNLYDTLLELSAFNVQAKSGKTQLPWNTISKNTNVSIGEFSPDDGLTISVLRTFELLHSLDQEKPKDQWVEDGSMNYNALANYGLATVLHKVLHLSEKGNQYLLTPSGFISFPERLVQLFTSEKSAVKVRGAVTINDNTLSKMYAVSITSDASK